MGEGIYRGSPPAYKRSCFVQAGAENPPPIWFVFSLTPTLLSCDGFFEVGFVFFLLSLWRRSAVSAPMLRNALSVGARLTWTSP